MNLNFLQNYKSVGPTDVLCFGRKPLGMFSVGSFPLIAKNVYKIIDRNKDKLISPPMYIYVYKHSLSLNFLTTFLWVLCLKKALQYDIFPQS